MSQRSVILAVEDRLSEAVSRKLLASLNIRISQILGLKGQGYLQQKAHNLNLTAKGFPVFMLTDQDKPEQCPPQLIQSWIPGRQNPDFFLRVAVMEVESWVLADRSGVATLLSIPLHHIPRKTDDIPQPKEFLVSLARSSRKTRLRKEIVPAPGATSKIGPGYNLCLGEFVRTHWNVQRASSVSESLRRTVDRLRGFAVSQ